MKESAYFTEINILKICTEVRNLKKTERKTFGIHSEPLEIFRDRIETITIITQGLRCEKFVKRYFCPNTTMFHFD